MQSLSEAPHAPPFTSDSKLSSQNVSESPVIIPGTLHFPPALHYKHWTHPRYHPPSYNQIFCSLPLTPQPHGPAGWELYCSWHD